MGHLRSVESSAAPDAVARLAARGVGQADHGEAGQALGHVDLDPDGSPLDTEEGGGLGGCEHGGRSSHTGIVSGRHLRRGERPRAPPPPAQAVPARLRCVGVTLVAGCDSEGHVPWLRSIGQSTDLRMPWPQHDTGAVGLNPFRQHRRSPADILIVAGALLVCVALVAWAVFG